jgi:hypothetical protein
MKTNCLNGIDECTNGLLLHPMLGINGIDDLYVLKKCSCNESALENPWQECLAVRTPKIDGEIQNLPLVGQRVCRKPTPR